VPDSQDFALQSDFPNADAVFDILRDFEDDPELSHLFDWANRSIRKLQGGVSGSLVLELTTPDGNRLILKIGRTRDIEDEITRTKKFLERAGNMAFGSTGPLYTRSSADGRWTGVTLYHAGFFMEHGTTPAR
jgi:hypothetical protein